MDGNTKTVRFRDRKTPLGCFVAVTIFFVIVLLILSAYVTLNYQLDELDRSMYSTFSSEDQATVYSLAATIQALERQQRTPVASATPR